MTHTEYDILMNTSMPITNTNLFTQQPSNSFTYVTRQLTPGIINSLHCCATTDHLLVPTVTTTDYKVYVYIQACNTTQVAVHGSIVVPAAAQGNLCNMCWHCMFVEVGTTRRRKSRMVGVRQHSL
jgi:hypothetical protein